jgi:hypothetical protein
VRRQPADGCIDRRAPGRAAVSRPRRVTVSAGTAGSGASGPCPIRSRTWNSWPGHCGGHCQRPLSVTGAEPMRVPAASVPRSPGERQIVSRPFGQLEAAAGRGTGVRAWSTRGVFPGGLRAVPCDVTPLRREAIVMLARSGQGGAAASRSWRCPLSETARTPMRWRRARNHPGTNATTALFVWHSRCRDRRRTSKFANTYRSTSLASRRGPGFLPRVGEEDSP